MNPLALSGIRLLIVDDEQAQLLALSELLMSEGYAVRSTTSPVQALELLAAEPADLLLTDLQMPGIDGLALMQRALALDPDLVTLLMTGHGSIETAVEAMKHGSVDFVMKPFRLGELRPVLARALEVRQLRRGKRELAQRLAERSEQLEAANKELDAFASRVAHDLQGPVQNMIAFARLLRDLPGDADPRECDELLARIIGSGARADVMIRDLLQFARLGNRPLVTERLALGGLLSQAKAMLPNPELVAGATWALGPLPTVVGDASLLLQVWVNLLSNALKYSAQAEQPRIDVFAEPLEGGGWRMWVCDNGVGFDVKEAHRLFAPFERLHGLSEFPGTGMGLANVKRIVERHGGQVGATSPPGGGARFSFTLPG